MLGYNFMFRNVLGKKQFHWFLLSSFQPIFPKRFSTQSKKNKYVFHIVYHLWLQVTQCSSQNDYGWSFLSNQCLISSLPSQKTMSTIIFTFLHTFFVISNSFVLVILLNRSYQLYFTTTLNEKRSVIPGLLIMIDYIFCNAYLYTNIDNMTWIIFLFTGISYNFIDRFHLNGGWTFEVFKI